MLSGLLAEYRQRFGNIPNDGKSSRATGPATPCFLLVSYAETRLSRNDRMDGGRTGNEWEKALPEQVHTPVFDRWDCFAKGVD
jgi:hypothetical protein